MLNDIAGTFRDRLRFSIVHDQALFDALVTPHKTFTPTCDHQTYFDLLGAAEISFMPLLDNAFNRAKSDLKFVEAGACRLVSLASRVVYEKTVDDGQTGVLFDSFEALYMSLTELLTDPGRARTIADNAREHVARERMLGLPDGAANRMVSLVVGATTRADGGAPRTRAGTGQGRGIAGQVSGELPLRRGRRSMSGRRPAS